MAAISALREKRNWQLHLVYCRQEYKQCLVLIEQQLKDCKGSCEYPLYVKGR
jgi:Bardet-Biedl syndrome 4 protein